MTSTSDFESEVKIGATVPSGFEFLAKEECLEKFGCQVSDHRGRIIFSLKLKDLKKVTELRAIDNVFAVVAQFSDLDLEQNKEEALRELRKKTISVDWSGSLQAWKHFTSSDCCISLEHATYDQDMKDIRNKEKYSEVHQKVSNISDNTCNETIQSSSSNTPDGPMPKKAKSSNTPDKLPLFRVTCNRVGKTHKFTSTDAASHVGGILNDVFHWPVKLKNYDLEVLLNIIDNAATVSIALTRESLFKRNIRHFGPTTLRSNICYSMLRLSKPQPGDIIFDPMCGGGSIPLEGALAFPGSFHIGADIHGTAVKRARDNLDAACQSDTTKDKSIPMDVFKSNCTYIPIRQNSVDIIISDLPFGKRRVCFCDRMGSKGSNWDLYYRSLVKMATIANPQRGRAVLLTQDRKCMAQTLQKLAHLWSKSKQIQINLGGLSACVYVLHCIKGRKRISQYKGTAETK